MSSVIRNEYHPASGKCVITQRRGYALQTFASGASYFMVLNNLFQRMLPWP